MENLITKEERNYIVYMHTSPSEKIYIGITSMKPEHRWANGKGYKQNKHFYNAICLYGWDNFEHKILFKGLTKEEAEQKEIELIAYYKSNDKDYGYNIALGGHSLGKLSEEHKKKIGNSGKIAILQYSKSFEFIKKWDSIIEASQEIGVSTSIISACCRGKEKSAGGYIWKYEQPELINSPKGHRNPEVYKSVDQYSLKGEFIATYSNMKEASINTGIDDSTISKCCNNKQKKTGGYIWRYHGMELTKEYIKWCNSTGRENARKPIVQYSIDNEFIKLFDSVNSVEKELGFDVSAIIRCCNGKQKTSYGYIWRYVSDVENVYLSSSLLKVV